MNIESIKCVIYETLQKEESMLKISTNVTAVEMKNLCTQGEGVFFFLVRYACELHLFNLNNICAE